MLLGEILTQRELITSDQLAEMLTLQLEGQPQRPLGEWLIETDLISEEDLLDALGQQFRMEVVLAIPDAMLDPVLVEDVPIEWARSRTMLPVQHKGRLSVLISDPCRVTDRDDLALLLGKEIIPVLAPAGEIRRGIEQCYYQRQSSTSDFLKDMGGSNSAPVESSRSADDILSQAGGAPVTKLVNLILLEAVKVRASDIHIEPFDDLLRVRYRIDGLLYEQTKPPKHLAAALVSRLKVMGGLDIAEKRLPQDGMARVRVGEREFDIRISTVPVPAGERVVLRLLDRDAVLLPLAELGMPDTILTVVQRLLQETNGAIWVTGPTGSGKTTTLYAALRELDTEHSNILTIEDPIEYQLSNIGQIAVKPKIGLTFSQGLRHILRQDPDVILVGETRDIETAEIAVRASLTGHLVLSTLHTNDAASAVIRLVDMGIQPYLLSAAGRAVLAQRLVRTLCVECREQSPLIEQERLALGDAADQLPAAGPWRARGCPACLGGYKGRTGIYELLVIDDQIRAAIHSCRDLETLHELAATSGMRTLFDDACVWPGHINDVENSRATRPLKIRN